MAERSQARHLMCAAPRGRVSLQPAVEHTLIHRETVMAPTRKPAKRSAGKKKQSARKSPSKLGAKKSVKPAAKRRRTRKTALGGLDTVRQVGEKTWKTLKSTTAQVMEGVKETFGG